MLSDFGLASLYSLISKKCGSPLIGKMWLVATGPEEAGHSRDIHGDESHLSPPVEAQERAPQLVRAILHQEIFSPNSCEAGRDVEDHLRLQERGQFMFSRDRSRAKYFVVGIEEMGGYLRSLIKSRDMQTSLNPYAEKNGERTIANDLRLVNSLGIKSQPST